MHSSLPLPQLFSILAPGAFSVAIAFSPGFLFAKVMVPDSQSLRDWRAGPWLGFLLVLVQHFGYHLAAFKQVSNLVPFPRVRVAGFCALASRVPFPPRRFSSSWFFCVVTRPLFGNFG